MAARETPHPDQIIRIRRALPADVDALMELEKKVFATDRMSRRSLRHFLRAPTAVRACRRGRTRSAGTATILFSSPVGGGAPLFDCGGAADGGAGVASKLLAAVESAARERKCTHIRLEVHATNHAGHFALPQDGLPRCSDGDKVITRMAVTPCACKKSLVGTSGAS
jgi:hypothetical protein